MMSGKSNCVRCYQVIAEKRNDPELGTYFSYGIQETTHSGETRKVLHDISTRKERVFYMAKLFTQHQLSPIHFSDVVEDMLP